MKQLSCNHLSVEAYGGCEQPPLIFKVPILVGYHIIAINRYSKWEPIMEGITHPKSKIRPSWELRFHLTKATCEDDLLYPEG